jgi:hypothetical protein
LPAVNGSELTEVDSLVIAQVLARAHQTALARNEPHAARAILHVAHAFADELARHDNGFDRKRFIEVATDHAS